MNLVASETKNTSGFGEELTPINQYQCQVSKAVMTDGQMLGRHISSFTEQDRNYLYWVAETYPTGTNINGDVARIWLKENPLPPSYAVGEIGEVLTIKLTHQASNAFQTKFGFGWAHSFVDDKKNQIIVLSSARFIMTLKQGAQITLSGTVKEHTKHNGYLTTTLVRPKEVK